MDANTVASTVVVWIQLAVWVLSGIRIVAQWRSQNKLYLLVLLGLGISLVSLYFNYRPRTVTVEKIVQEPYQFKWLGDNPPTKHFIGKHYVNQRVDLDDSSFTNCTFQNVTLAYNGTAPFQLNDDTFNGFALTSDNPSITADAELLFGLRVLALPFIDGVTGRPIEGVEQMRIIPPTKPKPRPVQP
jgi:hypothetical protein